MFGESFNGIRHEKTRPRKEVSGENARGRRLVLEFPESPAGRLPSQFLLVSVVRFQGGVDEELIEDVPLEENKQNKCKPMSKRPPSHRLAAPLLY